MTAIFYFSGTGNSLYVAKKMKDHIKDAQLYPIVSLMDCDQITPVEQRLVIIFPVYALTVPLIVRSFLSKLNFKHTKYIAVVATRLGVYFNDFHRIDKLLKKKQMKVDAYYLINMPNNDIKIKDYKVLSQEDFDTLEKEVDEQIEEIAHNLLLNKKHRIKDENYIIPMTFGDMRDGIIWYIVPKLMTFSKWIGGVNYFYVKDYCNGCGLCEKVCLSGKLNIHEKEPVWHKKVLCHMCYACINYCPKEAIQISSIPGLKSYSEDNERYHNPHIEHQEIANQKESL